MTPTESRRIRHIRARRPIIGLSLAFVLGLGRLVVGCGNSRPANLNEQTDGAPLSGAQCAHPYPGCACSEKGETSPCGTVRIQSENFIQCSMGTTTCDGTSWGACDGSITVTKNSFTGQGIRLVPQTLTGTACGSVDPCDPYCEVAAGEGGLTITLAEGSAPPVMTTVSGTVYDPGVNVPLPNITVYQPTGALIPLPDGVTCDTCASLVSPNVNNTATDVNGHFTLQVTPTAGSANVVMQTGRWRRQITVNGITTGVDNPQPTCTAATAATCQTRLPQTAAEGNIPLTALSTGVREPFECDFAKFMGGSAEMGPPSSGKRIQLFHDTGANTSPGAPDSRTNLWNSQANLDAYSVVLLPCSGTSGELDTTLSPTEEGYFIQYIENGGKMFLDHDSVGQMLQATAAGGGAAVAPFNTISTWFANNPGGGGSSTPTEPGQAKVTGNTPTHTLFQTWLTNQGAYGGGFLNTPTPLIRAVNPAAPLTTSNAATAQTFEWLRGERNNNWGTDPGGNYTAIFSFDMSPSAVVPPGDPASCGRVFYSGMHVDTSRGSAAGTFPSECSLGPPESPNEMAFEYLIFALTACSTVAVPPPPPPPPVPTTYTASVQANCPVGTHVQWGFFEWQSTVPMGTNITFTAQTAPDNGGMPGTYGPAVFVGQATSTTAGWNTDGCIVDGHLQDQAVYPNEYGTSPSCITGPAPGYGMPAAGQAPQTSQDWLQITLTLNPSGYLVPTLNQWQQLYDCPPTE
jgi:hypothetical protein